jgi:hypothetical protein
MTLKVVLNYDTNQILINSVTLNPSAVTQEKAELDTTKTNGIFK